MDPRITVTAAIIAVLAPLTLAAVWLTRRALVRAGLYDVPDARSSHDRPTPRGAGLAMTPILLIAWMLIAGLAESTLPGLHWAVAGAAILALVSWLDDLDSLPVWLRLAAQAIAVAVGLFGLGAEGSITQGLLPLWLDRLFAALAWMWFVNLFNFMDGIDGISAVEGGTIALGLAGLAAVFAWPDALIWLPASLLAVMLGFAVWNWAPARIFLGDVGSIPLGYVIGWLLILACLKGAWIAAIILPAYYWLDATWTLLRRLQRHEPVWRAHRQHLYQRAAARLGHAKVSLLILLANLALVAILFLTSGSAYLSLALAAISVAALVVILRRAAHGLL